MFRLSKSITELLVLALFILTGCSGQIPILTSAPSQTPPASATSSPMSSPTETRAPTGTPAPSATPLPTETQTPTVTRTPTVTPTPTITQTPTVTLTPTKDFPDALALMRAFCRYGPGKAYLYSHELREGDRSEVHGRTSSGSWLWIKPENLERHCWAAASVLEVTGEIPSVPVVQTELPYAPDLYGPPENVQASRDGDEVMVTWNRVWMTEDDDRGYLIEATLCQNGQLVWVAVQTNETSYEFVDEQSCSGESSGKIYTVEKHGYTDSVPIPWP